MSKKVFVGMSGGVDSSVTAALLKEQGYDVTGIYMKNWSQDLPGFYCPWKEDYQDAKRVATQLDIPLELYDFEKQYRQKVVDYMIETYKSGRTPNPDIMCNQEIKFRLFLDTAIHNGADVIATGHYARVQDGQLRTGIDTNKDQSYFLYRVQAEALRHSLMPIGALKKPAVRTLARKYGLATADKKDSQGICFIGNVGIKEFLLAELGPQEHGEIIDQQQHIIGEHEGALFYTIGQRHGLHTGGGLPYYVIGKDMKKNEVYVTTDLQDHQLWSHKLLLHNAHWINEPPTEPGKYYVRVRYRAPLVKVDIVSMDKKGHWSVSLEDEVRALTPGQSAVLYEGDRVVGGGIVI